MLIRKILNIFYTVLSFYLNAIRGPLGILTHWSLAPHVSKVPDPVLLAAHDVVVLGGLADETEGLVLAAKEEAGRKKNML